MNLTPATPEQAARLQQIHDRIVEIDKQRHLLTMETQALEREIAKTYGYGDKDKEYIVTHASGEKYAIRGAMRGDFIHARDQDSDETPPQHPTIVFGYGRKIRKDGTPAARSTYCGIVATDFTVKITG